MFGSKPIFQHFLPLNSTLSVVSSSKLLSSRFELEKKMGKKKGGGLTFFGWTYARGGGGHSDAYCVQQGGWGGLKIGKKCVRN